MSLMLHSNDFDRAKNQLQVFAKTIPNNPTIERVEEDVGPFGLFSHDVTGSEFNRLAKQVQTCFIEINKTLKGTIAEFSEVYKTFEYLDRDYIREIITAVKSAEIASTQAFTATEDLRKTQGEVVQAQTDIKKNIDVQKKIVEKLVEFKTDNEACLTTLRNRLDSYNSQIQELKKVFNDIPLLRKEIDKQKHFKDIDCTWSNVTQLKSNFQKLESDVKQILGQISATTKDLNNRISDIFKSLSGEIEEKSKIMESSVENMDAKIASTVKEIQKKVDEIIAAAHKKNETTIADVLLKFNTTVADINKIICKMNAKIKNFSEETNKKIDTVAANADQKIHSTVADVDQKIDSAVTDMHQNICKAVADAKSTIECIDVKISSSIEALTQDIFSVKEQNSFLQEKQKQNFFQEKEKNKSILLKLKIANGIAGISLLLSITQLILNLVH